MKLSANQVCPIHRRRDCCGRESAAQRPKSAKWIEIGPGIRKHKETGLVRRSPAAMRNLLAKKVQEQGNRCSLCGKEFTDAREITPEHTQPRGMGGARRDDGESNITAAHAICNSEKGSKRV